MKQTWELLLLKLWNSHLYTTFTIYLIYQQTVSNSYELELIFTDLWLISYYSLLQILFYKCLIGTLVFLLDSFGSQKISHVTAPRLNTVWTIGIETNSIDQKLFYYEWIISNNGSWTKTHRLWVIGSIPRNFRILIFKPK